ncbi:MAG: HIT domain-containing protein [Anaerolineae bacterium]|nr:HIT domain-containing protein [Anaerolineae bacterium]
MKQLWTPWRLQYMQSHTHNSECIFCAALNGKNDAETLIVYRAEHGFIILNRYPYTSAHVMVVPNAHQPSLGLLDDPARQELMALVTASEAVIGNEYHPHGFNIGANIGTAAGAGIAGHLHFHIVPRWDGDTNFMSTLGQVRVLPEELGQTYQRLRAAFQANL